jgi:hypothetical protein
MSIVNEILDAQRRTKVSNGKGPIKVFENIEVGIAWTDYLDRASEEERKALKKLTRQQKLSILEDVMEALIEVMGEQYVGMLDDAVRDQKAWAELNGGYE